MNRSERCREWEHIIPETLSINERCPACDRIQGIHNQIWACRTCNIRKGTRGLYDFIRDLYPKAKKISDVLPALLEKKYLKTIYYCHQCKGTLDWDGKWISVPDLDL
ncbi:MAG: hypothetical protein V1874_08900 [Spirochaetota bacterium]